MAKSTTHMKLSGKSDDVVYVKTKKGTHVRNAPKKGLKKDEPALKAQYSSTAFFNGLASQIKQGLAKHVFNFIDSQLYHRLLQRFRKVKEHNQHRWLLLREVQDIEVNKAYPLEKIGTVNWRVETGKRELLVHLYVDGHPPNKVSVHKVDCYYYELVLLVWNKTKQELTIVTNETDWIDVNGGLPEFEVPLKVPADATQWLLFIHGRLGYNHECLDIRAAEGMRCVEVGSFDKKDHVLVKKQSAAVASTKAILSKRTMKREGVKPKGMR